MNYSMQVELVRTLWQQARETMNYADQSWRQVMQSQNDLIKSMCKLGMPFEHASDQFEKMMDFHKEQYEAAMQHVDKMAAELQALQSTDDG